jgi:hypothetical protein
VVSRTDGSRHRLDEAGQGGSCGPERSRRERKRE